MSSEDTNILEFNQYQKSHKVPPFIIYADLEYEIDDGCKNNLGSSSTTKVGVHFHQVFQCLQYLHLKA